MPEASRQYFGDGGRRARNKPMKTVETALREETQFFAWSNSDGTVNPTPSLRKLSTVCGLGLGSQSLGL